MSQAVSSATPASLWAVGDLQGCGEALERLLARPELAAADTTFWFAGDLVNRGPQSLQTLRRVRALGERAQTVLGNHDLHLLGVVAGARSLKPGDTLREILDAPDAAELIDWIRYQPLAVRTADHLMVHAGVLPQWTADTVMALANEVETVLRGPNWRSFMHDMYGNQPDHWRDDLRGVDRLRVIVNALTRLRFCSADGVMEFTSKASAAAAPPGFQPWYTVPGRRTADVTVVFGHWSTLGLLDSPRVLAIDTGCIWGGELTAVRLRDRRRVAIDCSSLPGTRLPRG